MNKNVLVIGGGDTFKDYETYLDFLNNFEIDLDRYKASKNDWKPKLGEKLGSEFNVYLPAMPNKTNAQYNEWKIWFEKIVSLLSGKIYLVGHSLGASFLIKYLSENKVNFDLVGVFLVSGVFDKDTEGYDLAGFTLPEKLELQTENIFLYHSKDDPVVPFSALENFSRVFPKATTRTFEDRKHINQEDFPELVEDILSLN